MLSVEAPKGLSLAARRRWYERTGALEEAGRLTPARLELVTARLSLTGGSKPAFSACAA